MLGRSPMPCCRGHSTKLYSRKASSQNERMHNEDAREGRIAHAAKGGSRISQSQKTPRKTVNLVSESVQLSQLSGCWSRS